MHLVGVVLVDLVVDLDNLQARGKGSNLRIRVQLDLNEIAQGVEKKIKVKEKVKPLSELYHLWDLQRTGPGNARDQYYFGKDAKCLYLSTCKGSGKVLSNRPSGSDANGMIQDVETVSIKIPAGVEDGMQLKVTGKGNEAAGNGISGDLLVLIEEKGDDTFVREETTYTMTYTSVFQKLHLVFPKK